ncbi:3-keto-5-aminohexanoate cleavage protein [Streptomyces sp. NBC_00083]|uniref:3-keto-5-aminohexanoate cleavage protein n=1 Tax=Streptomyces sp. NBC_00083 TaxID=2975647 RepID=UPI002259C135|nr:3-keto-5-aminohexanoate cleavage protein [Streptomyces sp. NBC_00083]MCX5383367.1 3-keto-5-aminohexanoate cleavage protein [Streptomyces sp. NBC_00083]
MVQVCLNGARNAADGPAVPLSPAALAESAAAAVAAGAAEIHVHPKTPCGSDSLSPRVVGPALEAIRAAVRAPVGVTTGAWAEPDPARRVERVRSWTVLPDHASVNWHEDGAEEVAAALLDRGVGVEAGIWSGTDGARRFLASPRAPRVLRVLAEVTGAATGTAEAAARALLADLGTAHGRPVLLHGEDDGAWPVLRLARRLGLDTRIGLEDVLVLPDGRPARSNAELVTAALLRRPGASAGSVRSCARPGGGSR